MKWDINKPIEDFNSHLELEENYRIIFSGIFGIGKTYFLKEFFNDNNKYNCIHLYPVNYSVSRNEDIFELVKYDILSELLLSDKINFEDKKQSYFETLPKFLLNNSHRILAPFLKLIPKIGRSLYDINKELYEIAQDAIKDNEGKNQSQEEKILDFITSINETTGSIYENDFYTELIKSLLSKLVNTDESEENILILDDLDRIDPEHIFRILNVFASHFDTDKELPNKFGFDKIILVLDINNVRKIFANRYGGDVDFSGYIDKFFSHEIFYFNNRKAISQTLQIYFESLIKDNSDVPYYKFIEDDTHIVRIIIEKILIHFIETNQINLRNLKKLVQKDNKLKTYKIGNFFNSNNIQAIYIFDFFEKLFGNKYKFLESFNNLKPFYVSHTKAPEWIEVFLGVLEYSKFKETNQSKELTTTKKYNETNITIKYSFKQLENKQIFIKLIKEGSNVSTTYIPDIIKDASELYIEIIEKYK